MQNRIRKKRTDCFVCLGNGFIKRIMHFAHFGKFHIGREIKEDCEMCKLENFESVKIKSESIH